MELDDFDQRLLDAVQEDNRRTGEELAGLVGLSPAACLRRLQRLRASGVIAREVAILDPKLAGDRLTMVVLATMHRERPDVFDRFAREMREAPEVTQCYLMTGAVDFVLVVSVPDSGLRGLRAAPPTGRQCAPVRVDGGDGADEVRHRHAAGAAAVRGGAFGAPQPPKRAFKAAHQLPAVFQAHLPPGEGLLGQSRLPEALHGSLARERPRIPPDRW
jgi:Lrp/AsnC family transcriptional regulator, leucine-responsive regulatory protein